MTIETSVVEAIKQARAARDAGIAQAQEADRWGWNSALIDQAIRAFAETGRPFSANDLRHLLPDDLPGPLYGARFIANHVTGVIRYAPRRSRTTSTKKNTHGKDVRLWVGVPADDD